LQTESLGASLLLWADDLGVYSANIIAGAPGSVDLDGFLPTAVSLVTTLVELAALAAVVLVYRRGRADDDELLVTGFAASATAFTVFAKVLSPQFLLWLLPLVVLVEGRKGRLATILLLVSLGATQAEERGFEGLSIDGWAVWILLARNLLLVGVFVLLLQRLREQAAAHAAQAGSGSTGRRGRYRLAPPQLSRTG
jgi:hypothetical protein